MEKRSKLKRQGQSLGKEQKGEVMEEGMMWKRFREVQSVLERNRLLIKQVNDNHRSGTHDNMVRNVGLIQELNANISEVVSLYSHLSTHFSTTFLQEND